VKRLNIDSRSLYPALKRLEPRWIAREGRSRAQPPAKVYRITPGRGAASSAGAVEWAAFVTCGRASLKPVQGRPVMMLWRRLAFSFLAAARGGARQGRAAAIPAWPAGESAT